MVYRETRPVDLRAASLPVSRSTSRWREADTLTLSSRHASPSSHIFPIL